LVAKPSKEINNSDIIEIKYHLYTKTIRIIAIPTQRVSAKLVNDFILDITPVEEYAKLDMIRENTSTYKPKWKGRPTKKIDVILMSSLLICQKINSLIFYNFLYFKLKI